MGVGDARWDVDGDAEQRDVHVRGGRERKRGIRDRRRMSYRVSIPELAHESSLLRDIDLLEFTCPVALLEENSHVAEILDTSTMERKADIENILQESRLKDIFPSIVVNITDNVVTLHNPTI